MKIALPQLSLYAPCNRRSRRSEDIRPKESLKQVINDRITDIFEYDTTIPRSLLTLQVEYAETFANEDVPKAEVFAQRQALKQRLAVEYGKMATTVVNTFHARTRCPNCNQTPITTKYTEMNHSLPKGAWARWRDLCNKIEAQRPEVLKERDWIRFLSEMKAIEIWYWEDNTASVECGRISWNGNFAAPPLLSPMGDRGPVVVSIPSPGDQKCYSKAPRHGIAVPKLLGPNYYSKAVPRHGRAV